MTSDVKKILAVKYDALLGREIRDIKPTDIVNVTNVVTGTAATTSIATITTDALTNLYPYYWNVAMALNGNTGTVTPFALVVNTSTVAYLLIDTNTAGGLQNDKTMVASGALPITKVGISSSISVIVPTASAGVSYYTNLVCNREPILTSVENQIE